MSQALDNRVDALRERLIRTAGEGISMGNYKQQLRAYQEMMLELINIVDAVNATADEISPEVMAKLKAEVHNAAQGET